MRSLACMGKNRVEYCFIGLVCSVFSMCDPSKNIRHKLKLSFMVQLKQDKCNLEA